MAPFVSGRTRQLPGAYDLLEDSVYTYIHTYIYIYIYIEHHLTTIHSDEILIGGPVPQQKNLPLLWKYSKARRVCVCVCARARV
jgi:hypothetical protein